MEQLQAVTSLDVAALVDELTLARLCDRYHKLPSEVLREPYRLLMRTWLLQCEMDRQDGKRRNG